MNQQIPKLRTDFACIIDTREKNLAAVISSYLSSNDLYLPIFEFPIITRHQKDEEVDQYSVNHLSHSRATTFNFHTEKAIKKLGGGITIVIAGLSADQRAYLTFLDGYNLIEINSVEEVHFLLDMFAPHINSELRCKSSQVLIGLFQAINHKSRLIIDELSDPVDLEESTNAGIVIIEDEDYVASVLAVNYCLSAKCKLLVIDRVETETVMVFHDLIESWREQDSHSYDEIIKLLNSQMPDFNPNEHDFVTIFTSGLPYSLLYTDSAPFSYVHLHWRPDFLIFNNIFLASADISLSSAIVFSPEFFADEETKIVIAILEKSNCAVTSLIGEDSTVYNLDLHLNDFPFELLHVCSHGGEISGHLVKEEFIDRFGQKHIAEFDTVLSLSQVPGEAIFRTEEQNYYRKFDGLGWGSKQLRERKFPQEVFADMRKAGNRDYKDRKIIHHEVKQVKNSRSIKCHDSNFLGSLSSLASSLTSPFIFNNSCWSALRISESFIYEGCRGYLGTLWEIDTVQATDFAKEFYMELFNRSVSESVHYASKSLNDTESAGIYLYWGLHFTRIHAGPSKFKSKQILLYRLYKILESWVRDAADAQEEKTLNHVSRRIEWLTMIIKKI